MTDAASLENLTDRQQLLLLALVREYIIEPEPVSSKRLVSASGLQISSATARNEMVVLEEKGFIQSPHTSSGREPTEKGYRYFARYLLENAELPRSPMQAILTKFRAAPLDIDAVMETAAVILAQETQSAALVTEPRIWSDYRFKHIQLIGVQGRLVLMVLVLNSGHVRQQMLVMTEPVTQEQLSQASEALNHAAVDLTAYGVREALRTLPTMLAREIGELVVDALEQMEDVGARIAHRSGFSEVLSQLEEKGAEQALRVLEGKTDLDSILDDLVHRHIGAVRVIVAGEGRWEELSHLSMVVGRYGTNSMMGAIGVVGPTRMHYERAIPTVSYVAGLLSDFLASAHGIEDDATGSGSPTSNQ